MADFGPLPLDSPIWSSLTHAFGAAENIPALLRRNAKAPSRPFEQDEEPWHSLWSALAHQGDVYTASYAAAEHIAQDAAARPSAIWFDRMQIVGWIEHCRLSGRGPDVPDFLIASYARAREIARDKLLWTLANNRALHATKEAPYLLDSIAALNGWSELSKYIEAFPDGPNA